MGDRAYTLEIASLHMRLLVAMAAVDEHVRHVEVEEVLAFIDRPSLPHEDLARLEQLTKVAIADPPQLDLLLAELSKVASKPAIARLVVDDLAQVAAADSREDPRETELLATVCGALGVELPKIVIVDPEPLAGAGSPQPAAPRRPRLVNPQRVRAQVRRGLEASYREPGPGA